MTYQEAIQSLIAQGYRSISSSEETRVPISTFLAELQMQGPGGQDVVITKTTSGDAVIRDLDRYGFPLSGPALCRATKQRPVSPLTGTSKLKPPARQYRPQLRGVVPGNRPHGQDTRRDKSSLSSPASKQKPGSCSSKNGVVDWEICGVPPEESRNASLALKLQTTVDFFGISLGQFAQQADVDISLIERLYLREISRPRANDDKKCIENAIAALWAAHNH